MKKTDEVTDMQSTAAKTSTDEIYQTAENMRKIIIFDTTLRDGEQTPGAHLGRSQKVELAKQLEKLGADVIEAGFPASSKGEYHAVKAISECVKEPVVCALARCSKEDIDAAWDALSCAEKPRIHVFVATSSIHMEKKLKKTPEEVLQSVYEMVSYAKSLCEDIEFSAEDASRSEPEFLYKVCSEAIKAGAKTINIPDTVGYSVPEEFGRLIKNVRENVVGADRAVISVHCHDDLGNAVANSLAAIENGADQVECTVNGVGERAGNAALEEIAMTLKVRRDIYGVRTGINTKEIIKTSRMVSAALGVAIAHNKAVVGTNAFAHESGIHQHGVLADPRTYEIMRPEDIGLSQGTMLLGKLSGRHAFAEKLTGLGYTLDKTGIDSCFVRFKECADKKNISDDDINAIVNDYLDSLCAVYELDTFQIQSGNKSKAMAMITLTCKGVSMSEAAVGDGPIDAAFNAVNRLSGADSEEGNDKNSGESGIRLDAYNIKAVTQGTDALGEATVRIVVNGAYYSGRSVSTDIIEASIRAYINALNKWASL